MSFFPSGRGGMMNIVYYQDNIRYYPVVPRTGNVTQHFTQRRQTRWTEYKNAHMQSMSTLDLLK